MDKLGDLKSGFEMRLEKIEEQANLILSDTAEYRQVLGNDIYKLKRFLENPNKIKQKAQTIILHCQALDSFVDAIRKIK